MAHPGDGQTILAVSGGRAETLDTLATSIAVKVIDDFDKQKEYQAMFYQARQHFSYYFLGYAANHHNDWSWLEAEHANLLAATRYYQDTDNYDNLLAFRDALQLYLDFQGHWADSLRLNEWAIAAAQTRGDQTNAARFTHDRADVLQQLGEYHQAEHLYQISEQIYLNLGEKEMALRSHHMRSLVVRAQGRLAEAERLCGSTIADAQSLELHTWLAHPLYVQALLARDRGDFRQARQCIEDSLDRLANSNELGMIAQCYHFLGELALLQDNLPEARTQLTKSLQLSQSVGLLRRVAATQRLLGDVARVEGVYTEAENLYREAFEAATQLGDQPQQARILLSRAELAIDLNHKQEAIASLQNTQAIYQKIGDLRGVTTASLFLARLYLRQRDLKPALGQGVYALKAVWQARLFHPGIIIGVLKRRGKW